MAKQWLPSAGLVDSSKDREFDLAADVKKLSLEREALYEERAFLCKFDM